MLVPCLVPIWENTWQKEDRVYFGSQFDNTIIHSGRELTGKFIWGRLEAVPCGYETDSFDFILAVYRYLLETNHGFLLYNLPRHSYWFLVTRRGLGCGRGREKGKKRSLELVGGGSKGGGERRGGRENFREQNNIMKYL